MCAVRWLPMACLGAAAIALVGTASMTNVAWAARPSGTHRETQRGDVDSLQYAYNKRSPRWEAPQHEQLHPPHKPYKPLRQPPGTLPEHGHHGKHVSLLFSRYVLVGVSAIVVLGVGAEWIAWGLHVPAALVALVLGLIVGPMTGLLDPDNLFGHLLLPVVALCVAVLLFEAGLGWQSINVRRGRDLVGRLLTLGAVLTWSTTAAAAHFVFGLSLPLAALLGAVVLTPDHRMRGGRRSGTASHGFMEAILEQEIVGLELIGTTLAVLLFSVALALHARRPADVAVMNVIKAVGFAGLGGIVGVGVVLVLAKYSWLPQRLWRSVILLIVVALFAVANVLQPDCGFLAVMVMAAVLANQTIARIEPGAAMTESSASVLSWCVLIILAARLSLMDIETVALDGLALVAVVRLIARPAGVMLATASARLVWRERLLLVFGVPQGVVATALATIFALRLAEARDPQAAALAPLAVLSVFGMQAVSMGGNFLAARRLPADDAPARVLSEPTAAAR